MEDENMKTNGGHDHETLRLLLWLSETEAAAVSAMAAALKASTGYGPAILTVKQDGGEAGELCYSRPVSLSILAE
jgi:hypothetical protein